MAGDVLPGLSVAVRSGAIPNFSGAKVGLLTHAAAVTPDRKSGIDALRESGVKLVALFSPEHGIRGEAEAGASVSSSRDTRTGLPIFSLYGSTKVPTASMLRGVDVLAIDLQDIGARTYTYLSTLGAAMEGAAKHGVPVVVLDRPNPSGLARIEGGPVKSGFFSFVGRYPVAYRHGLTLGECAKCLIGENMLAGSARPELSVVACENLTRNTATLWPKNLPWVKPSPNVPFPATALLYQATGIVGELGAVSIGVGTDDPFAYCGAPGLDGKALVAALSTTPSGARCSLVSFTPARGVFANRRCAGVRVSLGPGDPVDICRVNFDLVWALTKTGASPFSGEGLRMFDLSCGSDSVRNAAQKGAGAGELWRLFQNGVAGFEKRRAKHLLY